MKKEKTPRRPRPFALTARDREIVRALFILRCASRDTLRRLFFGSLQRANTRLLRLSRAGYLIPFLQPTERFGLQAMYRLGPKSLAVARAFIEDQGFDLSPEQVRRQFLRPPLALVEHTAAIAHSYAEIRACLGGLGALSLAYWLPEVVARVEIEVREKGGKGRKEAFAPDAFFGVADGTGAERAFSLEVDLGHAPSSTIMRKVATARRVADSSLAGSLFGARDFLVLVATTSERRVGNLLERTAEFRGKVAFTTLDRLPDFGGPIWHFEPEGPARSLWPGEG